MCLFDVLQQMRREIDFALYAVHVNHQFRPGAAEADQAYVEELCGKHGITCIPFVYDCPSIAKNEGMTSEEAGRKVRYEAFRTVAQSLIGNGVPKEKVKIAVAQNAGDQAETVLLRLLRGTGPDGLAGMSYARNESDIRIIRPLLDTERKEIERYCVKRHLEPRIDSTNLEPVYTRNKVRLQLIPYLEEHYNCNISQALIRLSKIAGEDKEYLWKQAENTYKEISLSRGILQMKELAELEPAIRHRVVLKTLEEVGLAKDVTLAHLEAADQLVIDGKPSKSVDFPCGYAMTTGYSEVRFYKKGSDMPAERPAHLKITVGERAEQYPVDAAIFDWDKLCNQYDEPQIVLRTRQPGDYLSLRQGRKKLQDFFVDEKVPREQRQQILVVAVGSEILWVVATDKQCLKRHRYSEKYRLDPETKNVLTLEIICEI